MIQLQALLITLFFLPQLGSPTPWSQRITDHKLALRDITQLAVQVNLSTLAAEGLQESVVRTSIELRLRQNGIRVVPMDGTTPF